MTSVIDFFPNQNGSNLQKLLRVQNFRLFFLFQLIKQLMKSKIKQLTHVNLSNRLVPKSNHEDLQVNLEIRTEAPPKRHQFSIFEGALTNRNSYKDLNQCSPKLEKHSSQCLNKNTIKLQVKSQQNVYHKGKTYSAGRPEQEISKELQVQHRKNSLQRYSIDTMEQYESQLINFQDSIATKKKGKQPHMFLSDVNLQRKTLNGKFQSNENEIKNGMTNNVVKEKAEGFRETRNCFSKRQQYKILSKNMEYKRTQKNITHAPFFSDYVIENQRKQVLKMHPQKNVENTKKCEPTHKDKPQNRKQNYNIEQLLMKINELEQKVSQKDKQIKEKSETIKLHLMQICQQNELIKELKNSISENSSQEQEMLLLKQTLYQRQKSFQEQLEEKYNCVRKQSEKIQKLQQINRDLAKQIESKEVESLHQLKIMQQSLFSIQEIKNKEMGNISRNLEYYMHLVGQYEQEHEMHIHEYQEILQIFEIEPQQHQNIHELLLSGIMAFINNFNSLIKSSKGLEGDLLQIKEQNASLLQQNEKLKLKNQKQALKKRVLEENILHLEFMFEENHCINAQNQQIIAQVNEDITKLHLHILNAKFIGRFFRQDQESCQVPVEQMSE